MRMERVQEKDMAYAVFQRIYVFVLGRKQWSVAASLAKVGHFL